MQWNLITSRRRPRAHFCARLERHSYVTVDTEFLRETHLLARSLCHAPDCRGRGCGACRSAGSRAIELEPFFAADGATGGCEKVFHSARQDVEIIWSRAGVDPKKSNFVRHPGRGHGDAAIGDQARGYERFSLAKTRPHQIDKTSRLNDWKPPAAVAKSSSPMRCATSPIRTILISKPQEGRKARDASGREELAARRRWRSCSPRPSNYRQPSRPMPGSGLEVQSRATRKKQLAILIAVQAWREREAQARATFRATRVIQGRCHHRDRHAGAGQHRGAEGSGRCPAAMPLRGSARNFSFHSRRPGH